jgi:hypothetical protein
MSADGRGSAIRTALEQTMELEQLDPEPDACVILVGQDRAGHWLVQDCRGYMEGRFVSRAAALSFARAESRCAPGGCVVLAHDPLTPKVSFAPLPPLSLDRAA